MRKCFLHIGTHKTGTTAIQMQLNNNRAQLAEHGFLYPKTGIPDNSAGHHNIAWQLRGDRRFVPKFGTLDDLFLEIDESDHHVILSSEDFECAVGNLGNFIGRLEQHGRKVVVVVYLRDQLSYCRSLYLELTNHKYDRTFSDFLSELIEQRMVRWQESLFVFDYRVLLNQLPSTTTIIARPFCRETSVIGDFVSITGLSPAHVNIDPHFRIHLQRATSTAVAALYQNRTGRNIERQYKRTMELVSRAFDSFEIDLSSSNKERLIVALQTSNRSMDESFGMPMLVDVASDTIGSAPLELEAVFSTSTLNLIDQLCQMEDRSSWSIFKWSTRN